MICPDIIELREWIKFAVVVIGGIIALKTYVISQRQRKLENSLKLIGNFFSSLQDGDISEWKRIFMNCSESAGTQTGYFIAKDRQELPLNSLFSEGPDDNGAVNRIVQELDLIAYEALRGTVDIRFLYARIGQLVDANFSWFGGKNSLISQYYPNYDKLYRKYSKKFSTWPTKIYSYSE